MNTAWVFLVRPAVCTVFAVAAAAPSFGFAHGTFDARALAVAVGVFIIICMAISFTPAFKRHMESRVFRLTLVTVILTRIGITLVFPVGAFHDLLCGIGTLVFLEVITGGNIDVMDDSGYPTPNAFGISLAGALFQGLLLSISMALYGAIVFRIVKALERRREEQLAGLCRRCGYDLRASPVRCPECGMPVPAGHRPDPAATA